MKNEYDENRRNDRDHLRKVKKSGASAHDQTGLQIMECRGLSLTDGSYLHVASRTIFAGLSLSIKQLQTDKARSANVDLIK